MSLSATAGDPGSTVGTGLLVPLTPRALWLAALAALSAGLVAALVLRLGPVPALAVLAALPVGAVMLLRPDLATLVTAFLLYVNVPAILTKEHGVPALAAGAFIALLFVPLVHALVVRREGVRWDKTLALMLVFLVCLLLSTFVSVRPDIALERTQQYVAEGLLLYWLVINAARHITTLRMLLWTVLAAASLLSLLCLYQDVTGSHSQEFGGLAHRNYDASQDSSAGQAVAKRQKWDRAQGPVDEPNRFAQILVVLLPFAAFLHRHAGSVRARWWAAALGAATLLGVALTLSRGAFVTLVVLGGAMLFFRWLRPRHVLGAVLAAAVVIPAISPFFLARLESIFDARHLVGDRATMRSEADGAIRGRTTEMLAALGVFRDHPVLGVGPGQFARFYFPAYSQDASVKFRDISVPRRAHNLYLEMGAELGALGLGVFMAIVGVVMHSLWSARRFWLGRDVAASDLATACYLSLVAYLTSGVFLHLSYQRYYWFLLALSGATLQVLRTWPRTARARGGEESRWQPSR